MNTMFSVLQLHWELRTQKQTVNSQLLASEHTVSLALLAFHNCGSHYIHVAKEEIISKKAGVYSPFAFAQPFF